MTAADLTRATLFGLYENENTYDTININEEHALNVNPIGPITAFGEFAATHLDPKIQIDSVYGLVETDTETLIDASPGTGDVSIVSGSFVCSTGTGVGGYGVLRSKRLVRYKPGQGVRLRFTAAYTSGVANSIQAAGGFTATELIGFGYNGTTFGVHRRIAGAATIARLTVSGRATTSENMTVALNSSGTIVASGGSISTTALTAQKIAYSGSFTGWSSIVSPTSNGTTVTFIQGNPAASAGTYSFSSTGGATGTFQILQSGSANDDTTGFIGQSSWNLDTCMGEGGQTNPSGFLLDPTKLNVYEILFSYLGAGTIHYRVQNPVTGRFITTHKLRYPNAYTIPSMKNPTLKLGWIAASLGSTTNLSVKGASAAAFIEGSSVPTRDPVGVGINGFTAGTVEYCALAIRVGSTFSNVVNQKEFQPKNIIVGTETSNRVVRVRCVVNPQFSSTLDWSYVNSARTCLEYSQPTTTTIGNGGDVAYAVSASGAATTIDLSRVDLRLEPGDVLAIMLQTATNTAVCTVALNGIEN